jgi:hypothetical protein
MAVDLPVKPMPETAPGAPTIRQYSGIFRGGFEASHFYTMDGEGPWWLVAEGAIRDRIYASFVDGPGRAGGVTVALTANGWLEETGGEFEYLGIDEYRFHIESVEGIRALTAEEFELVLATVTGR